MAVPQHRNKKRTLTFHRQLGCAPRCTNAVRRHADVTSGVFAEHFRYGERGATVLVGDLVVGLVVDLHLILKPLDDGFGPGTHPA